MSNESYWWVGLAEALVLRLGVESASVGQTASLTLQIDDVVLSMQPGRKERSVVLTSVVYVLPGMVNPQLLEGCLAANLHAFLTDAPIISLEPRTRSVVLQQTRDCNDCDEVMGLLEQFVSHAERVKEKFGVAVGAGAMATPRPGIASGDNWGHWRAAEMQS
ncbi:MAG: type III secretion system chaperone [Ottowia sp.]|nr:type III secretion system chaperone [Ottowia sp.]